MNSLSVNHSSLYIPYEKPISTWKALSTSLNPAERDYVKSYLGQALIEQCEEIENEIDNLLDIWRDYRTETVANCTDLTQRTLAEPPVLRKRLTKEIEFFVNHIHEQCAKDDQIFRRRLSNGHNWNAINYALVAGSGDDEQRIRERPVSARDRHGRETPILVIPEPTANIDDNKTINSLSPRALSTIDVNAIRKKLQDFTIDDAIQRLREAINEDIKTLENHVTYVHQKLDEEADYRAKTRGLLKEPTLGELRDERNRLEKEIFHSTNPPEQVELANSTHRQIYTHDTSRRSSASSMNSSLLSPRSSLDEAPIKTTHSHGPMRAFAPDSLSTSKPGLSIDRKSSNVPTSVHTKTSTPVLVRLGSIKQQDLLKKYPTLATTNTTTTTTTTSTTTNATATKPKTSHTSKSSKARDSSATPINSAEKFRRMVLDCREVSN